MNRYRNVSLHKAVNFLGLLDESRFPLLAYFQSASRYHLSPGNDRRSGGIVFGDTERAGSSSRSIEVARVTASTAVSNASKVFLEVL